MKFKQYKYTRYFNDTTTVILQPELQAAIDRAILEGFELYPTLQQNALNTWIKSTKANGNIWNNLTHARIRAYGTTVNSMMNISRINLKNPNSTLAVLNGGITLTPNGYLYNGVNGYCNDKFNPTTEGLNIGNLGFLHDTMNDFPASSGALFGVQQPFPNRRLGFFPKTGGENPKQSYVFSNDLGLDVSVGSGSGSLWTTAFGRLSGVKYGQTNNNRQTYSRVALEPIMNLDYYSGAFNNNGVATGFSSGTERLFMAGRAMTEAEVNQQIIINNTYYTTLGLPINS